MKSGWYWVIGVLVFSVVVVALVVIGVVRNDETEPRFLEDAIAWSPQDLPLSVCASDRRTPTGALGAHAHDALHVAIRNTNARLGFDALRIADEPCDVILRFGVPAEPGWRDPGGDASWRAGERVCHVAITNVHGELETLTVQHELGHCLGLAHDHFVRSIMHPTQSETPDRMLPPWISDVDRAALRERFLP